MLFHELDAFVFRDELEAWCDAGYDYIGAPWFEHFTRSTGQSAVLGVGNGGFSLRRVSAALRVLRSFSYVWKPRELLRDAAVPAELGPMRPPRARPGWRAAARLMHDVTVANNTFYPFNDFAESEDKFWGLFARRNFPWFAVAPPHVASRFSIEVNPRQLYALNGRQLPFGCHGWQKYDPEFWTPHIRRSLAASSRREAG